MKRKFYFAYGSNMSVEQMEVRCPGAKFIDVGKIEGYELLFKGSMTGSYATIEKKTGAFVPVWIWTITPANEHSLDRYEGCPNFYYKTQITASTEDGPVEGMVYIMHEDRKHGVPRMNYYKVLYDGYKVAGFDLDILRRGYMRSYEETLEAHRDELFY